MNSAPFSSIEIDPSRLKAGAAEPDPVTVGKNQSIEFFICSALMLVFGAGFHSYGAPVGLELALAAAVAGAGLFMLTGNEQARIVGIVVLGAVALVGGVSTFSGSYMPGTIVAVVALVRMLSTGGGIGSRGPRPDPPGTAQGSYGQPAGFPGAGTSRPYGGYGEQPAAQPQPYGQPQPYTGDPRFGAPLPGTPLPPAPAPPAPPAG